MLFCKSVARYRKIVILIYQSDIETGRTRLAMIAVNAFSERALRCGSSDLRIIEFFVSFTEVFKQRQDVVRI